MSETAKKMALAGDLAFISHYRVINRIIYSINDYLLVSREKANRYNNIIPTKTGIQEQR
ncbi:hypothetical protein [Coxiella endosymbiont of Ornithodoros maritimus]|uniref:hypothetical protein n=1 Tax=Coxiella endosymbiont of Ornithodoros maritimus TaxID=1656172 RepID=UPI00226496F6|nr:hypothetical protein [Coxiella endosymbiont of Ornithodoros maritimus]